MAYKQMIRPGRHSSKPGQYIINMKIKFDSIEKGQHDGFASVWPLIEYN